MNQVEMYFNLTTDNVSIFIKCKRLTRLRLTISYKSY